MSDEVTGPAGPVAPNPAVPAPEDMGTATQAAPIKRRGRGRKPYEVDIKSFLRIDAQKIVISKRSKLSLPGQVGINRITISAASGGTRPKAPKRMDITGQKPAQTSDPQIGQQQEFEVGGGYDDFTSHEDNDVIDYIHNLTILAQGPCVAQRICHYLYHLIVKPPVQSGSLGRAVGPRQVIQRYSSFPRR